MSAWSFFDQILYINLAFRPDRNTLVTQEFERVGIKATRIDAVSGDNRVLAFNESWWKAISQAKGFTLILEDDVVFKGGNHLYEALQELPTNWDLLYLGCNIIGSDLTNWPTPEPFSKHLRRIKQAWTSHAIAFSDKGLQHVRDTWKWEEGQIFDDYLRCQLDKLQAFVINPMIADQTPGYSDIWGHVVNYGFFTEGNKRMAL